MVVEGEYAFCLSNIEEGVVFFSSSSGIPWSWQSFGLYHSPSSLAGMVTWPAGSDIRLTDYELDRPRELEEGFTPLAHGGPTVSFPHGWQQDSSFFGAFLHRGDAIQSTAPGRDPCLPAPKGCDRGADKQKPLNKAWWRGEGWDPIFFLWALPPFTLNHWGIGLASSPPVHMYRTGPL